MFAALAVGAGYALLLIPNVELITAIVFAGGVYLGTGWGLTVGVLAEFVFSAANPLGSGLVFLPLLAAQVVGMGVVGSIGGMLRKPLLSQDWPLAKVLFLGAVGAVLTLVYDTLTTLSYPVAAGFQLKQTVAVYLAGMAFTVLHQVSNAIIFATALPRLFSRVKAPSSGC
ncbi:MAG: hypothetical protein ACE5GH_02505 [Fidelibacterota bacterium]